MIGRRRARWWCVGVLAPLVVVVGLFAMHGVTGSEPTAQRSIHAAHEKTSTRGHQMPTKSSHDPTHAGALCVWLLVAGFALLALRPSIDRLRVYVGADTQRIATQGRAVMRAPPAAVRLSMVGVSRR